MVKTFLHVEGLIVLLASVYFYAQIDASWWLFFLCLFIPDLFMLGYVVNNAAGSMIYNVGHSYIIPGVLLILSVILQLDLLQILSVIWVAHIGMDRSIGYGLKDPSSFKVTHLQKV